MFLIDIDDATLAMWKKDVFADEKAKKFYDALGSEYVIYHSFDSGRQMILYEAIKKDDTDYQSFLVGDNREIEDLKGNTENPCSMALALYLSKKEKGMNEAELKKLYGEEYEKISSLASLPKEEAQLRKRLLPLMKKLSDDLIVHGSEMTFETYEKLKLSYFITGKDGLYVIRIKVGLNNRNYFAKNTFEFLSACMNGGKAYLSKDRVHISPENIKDEDKPVINYLYQEGTYFNHAYSMNQDDSDLTLDESLFVRFMLMMKGRMVHVDNMEFLVGKERIEPHLSFDGQGNFSVEPELEGRLLSDGKNGALVDDAGHRIKLLSFPNEKEMIMIRFLLENRSFPFYLFQNELCESVLPMLSDDVSVSDEYLKNHLVRKSEIQYFITYTDDDVLSFRTVYLEDGKEVSRDVFCSTAIGENKSKQFDSALEYYSLPLEGKFISQEQILSFLKEDLFPLRKCATLYLSDNLAQKKVVGVGKIRIRMRTDIDWLNMDFGSDIYSRDELDKILEAYHRKKKYVRLNGSFISFEEEDSQGFVHLMNDFNVSSLTEERLPIYDALKLSGYSDDEVSVIYGNEIKELFDDIKNFKNQKLEFDSFMEDNLRSYQIDGVKWLYTLARHNLCGILADDMGLGKTLEIIALLSLSKSNRPILIVSPKSLIYNWENEFRKWNPQQKVFVFDGNKNSRNVLLSQIDQDKKEVFIISYDSLRTDLDEFVKYSFSYVILDEGQNISNVYAKKTKAVKEISADHKFVLTGTPIQNSLVDLWSIFDFLMPGYLSGFHDFSLTYGKLSLDDPQEKQNLMNKVAPFILKRTKKEVLDDLPNKEEQTLTILMNETQRKLYDAYIQEARMSLDRGMDRITILSEITRLREICVDPSMFLEEYGDESEKLNSAISLVKSAIENGHKILIFSCFLKSLLHLKKMLEENNIPIYLISGDTKAKDRVDMAEDFNTHDDVKVMLVSLKAGGTGLNLIGADIVIHLDPWWNLAAEEQASDRAYRIGQKRNVTILKLICKDTIEERVIELQKKKQQLTSVIQEGDSAIRNINTDDLRFLLS